jgi:hypothetical protein
MNKWTKFAGTVGALFGFMLVQRHTDWQTTAGLLRIERHLLGNIQHFPEYSTHGNSRRG